jgi:transposase-like protein
MAGIEEKLGAKQEAALLALLSSRNVEEAARTAGVSPRALFRWMKEPAFNTAYRAARRAAFGQTVARLQYASGAAASVLLKVLADPATPASTKVRAAESVLAHTIKAMEVDDIDARVTELERAQEETNRVGGSDQSSAAPGQT